MSSTSFRTKVFVSYSHRDRELKEKFDDNLRVLKVQGLIDFWTDGEILPGDRWSDEITRAMNEANLILFLVSNPFISSTFIREKEAPMAIERQKRGEAVIVPILLHDTPGWFDEAWSGLEALPSEVKPVDHPDWRTPENAFANVEKRLRELIKTLPKKLANHGNEGPTPEGHDTTRPGTREAVTTTVSHPRKFPRFVAVSLVTLAAIALVARLLSPPDPASAPTPPSPNSPAEVSVNPTVAETVAPAEPAAGSSLPAPPRVVSGRLIPAPVIPPKLRAWLESEDLVDLGLTISAAKENAVYQSGLQSLQTNDVVVTARRIPRLLWEVEGKTYKAQNGIAWDFAVDWGTSGAEAKTFDYSIYIAANEKGSPMDSRNTILIDGKDPRAPERLFDTTDAPHGFTHSIVSSLKPTSLPKIFGRSTITSSFYGGEKGEIPQGLHCAIIELRADGMPVCRRLFLLDAPPLVYNQSQDEWTKAVSPKVDQVSLVENSVFWNTENELEFSILVEGDLQKLRDPVSFVTYVSACDTFNVGNKPWSVDPYLSQVFMSSDEIEGFDYSTFRWASANNDSEKITAIQQIQLKAGPRGKFAAGKHDVALELSEYGLPAWRGFLVLNVPEKPWSFTDNENLLELTTTDGQDIRGLTLAAHRAQPHPNGLPVGMGFGPLKYKSKGSPLTGEFLIQYHLRATRAPQPPAGLASISAGSFDGIALFDRPDEGGFTARAAGTYPIEDQGGTGEGILQNLAFFVGADATHPGEILPGTHTVGIEILHRESPTTEYRPVYRGITTLWLAQ